MTPHARIALASARVRPTRVLKARLGFDPSGKLSVDQVLAGDQAVRKLADLMRQKFEARLTADGRVDWDDVSADVLAELTLSQKG